MSLFSPRPLLGASVALRLAMLVYGLYQDAVSAVKYTDVDYLVFTDAARAIARGGTPYERETYRYTPLVAWLLCPSVAEAARGNSQKAYQLAATAQFAWGKAVFAAADVAAGWLLLRILMRTRGLPAERAGRFAAVWLLNPMVATISTRGSSEGLLALLTAALLYATLHRKVLLAGALLGLGVHLKIYPFMYAPALVWWMDAEAMAQQRTPRLAEVQISSGKLVTRFHVLVQCVAGFVTYERVVLTVMSLAVFMVLNAAMYLIYGHPFLEHTFLYHVTRLDHRHNFSPYNILLYLSSADNSDSSDLKFESLAFVPQLLLSTVLIPLVCAKRDLPTTMLAQTYAFVTFNKVCTSQYFIWYLIFLPLYLPQSSLIRRPTLGITALVLWLASQAAWLQQAYGLEFLGLSTYVPMMWLASLAFFMVNCWILGIVVQDAATGAGVSQVELPETKEK